ncbi:MAG: hypothetical protein IKD76_03195 [Clostridia bacterium]|nr:hypothetical protein [Clostridia bacterium]
MRECLLCKRDMKIATTVFGSGCIKSIYKILDIKLPKNVKDKESYLYKSIMKKLNIKNLNTNQKVWLADRYLTYQYIDKLKYGDYTELKDELNEDIAGVKEVVEFSEFKTAKKVELKQAYTLYKKEEKFDKYISKVSYAQDTAKVGLKLLWETSPINLIIKKNTNPFEIPAIKSMQYVLWQVVAIGGNVVGFDSSAELLEHSLTDKPKDLLITEGKIVDEIKNDSQFQQKLKDIVIKYGKDTSKFNTNVLKIQFDNSDLYFAIHGADIIVAGEKINEKWKLDIEIKDPYDYTEFKDLEDYVKDANSVPKSMFSSFIYNLAHISVMLGVIKEYNVIIRFTIDNYEVI